MEKIQQKSLKESETLFAQTAEEKTQQAQAEPAAEAKKPYAKIRVGGGIQITFWEREVQRGDQKIVTLQPSITNSWRDKDGNWQNRSITMGTMAHLYELLAVAGEIRAVHQRFRDGLRSVAGHTDEKEEEA